MTPEQKLIVWLIGITLINVMASISNARAYRRMRRQDEKYLDRVRIERGRIAALLDEADQVAESMGIVR